MSAKPPVVVTARCASCDQDVELWCEGLSGYPGYLTYHEYACPHCRKRNDEKTPGAILEARKGAARAAA